MQVLVVDLNMQFQSALHGSEIGLCRPVIFRNSERYRRMLRLSVGQKQLSEIEAGCITSMELDSVQKQYLISAGSQRCIFIHNTYCSSHNQIPLVGMIDKKQSHQHKKGINRIQWYPNDTGIFVTSSFDHTIKIWDSNNLKPVETICLNCPIFDHHISPLLHILIAATASAQICLTDIRTGSASHILQGHQGNVLSLRWSPKDEYVLASGSEDNRIYCWDIRQAKAVLHSLDQHNGKEDCSKTKKNVTAHNGHVNSLLYNIDGRFLLSFATDERLHLWNTETGANTFVNYGRIENTSKHRPLYMTIMNGGSDTSVVVVPSGRHILLVNLFTGEVLKTLSDHFSNVQCCELDPFTQDLYTSAQSSRVLIMSPDEATQKNTNDSVFSLLKDTWSDSD